jgi:hypothetical protein
VSDAAGLCGMKNWIDLPLSPEPGSIDFLLCLTPGCFNQCMETPDKNLANETLEVLKAIHAEQQQQGKHLRNIYQIQLVLFATILIAVAGSLIAILR